jgi:DNA polymerase
MDNHLHIDFETYGEIDLTEVGAYRYAEHPATEPLCLAYAHNDAEPRAWAPSAQGRACPTRIAQAIEQGFYFCAHNAQFERAIWRYVMVQRYGWPDVPMHRWRCTAAMAAAVGFPRSLDGATRRAQLPEHLLKDKRGAALLKIFSQPRKPTKMDQRTRILPEDEPDDFDALVEYCKQDVRAERGLFHYLPDMPAREWLIWLADLKINETGMPLDLELLAQSIRALTRIEAADRKRCNRITGVNPTQRDRILDWLEHKGCMLPNLQLETVQRTLANKHIYLDPKVRDVLGMRIEASRASTKKISKMLECAMGDARARGMYLYAGAHTLRWSSRILQLHNFIRGYDDPVKIKMILDAYRTGDADFVRALFKNPIWELSKCIRGFIAAPKGKELGVVDYSQIEARNLDWHAGNEAGLEMWADGSVDPYIVMATHIYGCSYEEVKNQKSGEMRRIGKNTTLGAGFQMSAGAWLNYARKMGSKADEDLAELAIGTYREINKAVVEFWSDVNNHAIAAIAEPSRTVKLRRVAFEMVDHWLTIILPSGRRIWYPYARITEGTTKYGKKVEQIVFMGANHQEHTYGGKEVENIVQATSRDIMAGGLVEAMRKGYEVVGHTHDEILTMGKDINTDDLIKTVCVVPPWAKGMPLVAKAFTSPFYWKG